MKIEGTNIRKFPHLKAKIIKKSATETVQVLGKFGAWYCVMTDDGSIGYCYKDRVKPIPETVR